MLRYMLFVLTVTGSVATAIAAVGPVTQDVAIESANVTVIEKNQAFPYPEELIIETCTVEDCSDTPS